MTRAAPAAEIAALHLAPSGAMPNHPRWPALLYRRVLAEPDAERFERRFAANGWPPQWRDGIYPFHHYHTLGHEVLGCARGAARVMLGGPDGTEVRIEAGDAVLLPAGTGHCRLWASPDFLVVGAYPPGQQADICRAPATTEMRARIAALPRPAGDPLGAADGVATHWRD